MLVKLLYFMWPSDPKVGAGGTPVPGGALLLENGDYLLLESGDKLLLQG